MFQMLKPTLILLWGIILFLGAMQLIYDLCHDSNFAWFIGCWYLFGTTVYTIYAIRKVKREKAQQAAKESNIVTIDNEDCLGQDKDNPKL